jgi:hypothetical protein
MSGAAPEKVAAAPAAPARASASPTGKEAAGRRYVDPALGFEISRPVSGWQLETSDETTPEGLAIPVMLRHRDSGAQVVVQVAPAIASPTEFAERLTAGLRGYAGFTSGEPEPLPMREGAVGFGFELSGRVRGRVAVMEGGAGQMFIILATWPADVRDDVRVGVDEIFSSLRPVPKA